MLEEAVAIRAAARERSDFAQGKLWGTGVRITGTSLILLRSGHVGV